ncbi:MAG: 6,7-dimethyl-8-ribityllumazine synthase [Rhodospirillales bacterium]|nr:6,7-dimethyl-8-ribityllumazine synthase [Rhodospirillales bacterium]MCW8862911.1 6,7-dimethyl-8-ribityllumazine synthase [Rhodospirillales bacterium]MCW8951122.1 6,7-dimethyl-8-ribityllumazine synthase [Rhodospirillales bacterium]MCW8969684.1 6,7-dimethyl-8-ribityllumazine synthase [Rhodospirillales bacterium]MCW9003463.1 6,7-dimethyl-8-ribityllumazine synthase [Rhodospirillales bacterium]
MSDQDTPRVLIVEARFYQDIADELMKGALGVLEAAGVAYQRIEVPGVFEIPAAIRFAIRSMELRAASRRFPGFISLGCVIRGETSHYDYVAGEASRALMDLSVNYSIAHGFGVLTCENYDQAWARADVTGKKNVGGRAAEACLQMMDVKKQLHLVPR